MKDQARPVAAPGTQAGNSTGTAGQDTGPGTDGGYISGADKAGTPVRSEIRVEIYVTQHCPVCAYAHEVAATIRADFPKVDLRVIDLMQTSEAIPEAVFATPTYLLNGRLWSLGNPAPEDVRRRLAGSRTIERANEELSLLEIENE